MQKVLTDIVLATIFICMLSVGIAGEPGYNQTGRVTSQNEQKAEHKRGQDCLLSTTAMRLCTLKDCNTEGTASSQQTSGEVQACDYPAEEIANEREGQTEDEGNENDISLHPYPTLGQTKYFVFALREIIV